MAAVAAAMYATAPAQAATRCEPTAQPGVERCVTGLPQATIDAMAQTQRASQWCWAASISMVLRNYGVIVPQEQIVREHYGAAADLPVPGDIITGLLNRTWRDRTGRAVTMTADVQPAAQAHLSAPEVLDDLDDERPLVLVLPRHAVVLVQLEYERTVNEGGSSGPTRLLGGIVLDPRAQAPRALRPTAAIVHMTRVLTEPQTPVAALGSALADVARR
jgi:hypothetical protein